MIFYGKMTKMQGKARLNVEVTGLQSDVVVMMCMMWQRWHGRLGWRGDEVSMMKYNHARLPQTLGGNALPFTGAPMVVSGTIFGWSCIIYSLLIESQQSGSDLFMGAPPSISIAHVVMSGFLRGEGLTYLLRPHDKHARRLTFRSFESRWGPTDHILN